MFWFLIAAAGPSKARLRHAILLPLRSNGVVGGHLPLYLLAYLVMADLHRRFLDKLDVFEALAVVLADDRRDTRDLVPLWRLVDLVVVFILDAHLIAERGQWWPARR